MEVPAVGTFEDIYPGDAQAHQTTRWNNLLSTFEKNYGDKADFVSRSPGRVNIIGEHIDYSLYQVLPMAVTVDVLLAVKVRKGDRKIRIANVNSQKFSSREFEIPEGEIEIDAKVHEWSNYFKAGLRGASELLKEKQSNGKAFTSTGMDILVDGSVPAGGGLSSSAAFVCASALAVMKANGEEVVDKTKLTELAIVSERAVGVNSGGMDQSASVFALRDSALLVSFKPSLKADVVSFPKTEPEFSFVVAQSYVTSNKQVTGPIHYNLRVVECTLAAQVLAKIFGIKKPLPEDDSPLGSSLRGFHDAYFEMTDDIKDNTQTPSSQFQEQLEKLMTMTEDYLPQEEGYSRQQIADLLGITVDELNERFTTKVPVRAQRFLLRQRALHVFSEALRVQQFMALLNSKDEDPKQLAKKLGQLLNETQDSCRDLYDCSCPEIDELCDIARAAGAYGSRLTGAGWGGCSVHLVPANRVEGVKKAWREKYYNKRFPELTEEELEEAVVVSKPGRGSLTWDVSGRQSV